MENSQILNLDFNIINKNLPMNLYAVRVFDVDNDKTFDVVINHDGNCPNIYSERDQSRFNDYLSNLEYEVIDEFYKKNNLKKPNNYYSKIEVMTNNFGEIIHYLRAVEN